MLTLEALSIQQGSFTLSADWSVEPGRLVTLVGPSGAGKSTLLAAIGGFLSAASGRILWDGRDITRDEPGDRPVSTIFQDNNLFPHLSAAQNVGLGLKPSLRLSGRDVKAVEQALERVGLAGLGERKPAALSGGQQSRVALARALLRARPLMILDEPFSALGPGMRLRMMDLVSDLANDTGATVLMVTHDPKDALHMADQTILVSEGMARAPQDTHALFADPPEALLQYLT